MRAQTTCVVDHGLLSSANTFAAADACSKPARDSKAFLRSPSSASFTAGFRSASMGQAGRVNATALRFQDMPPATRRSDSKLVLMPSFPGQGPLQRHRVHPPDQPQTLMAPVLNEIHRSPASAQIVRVAFSHCKNRVQDQQLIAGRIVRVEPVASEVLASTSTRAGSARPSASSVRRSCAISSPKPSADIRRP